MKPIFFLILFTLQVALCFAQEESKQDEVDQLATQIVSKLVQRDFEAIRANFDANMKAALSLQQMTEGWETMVKQVGPFQKQLSVYSTKAQNNDLAIVKCQFSNGIVSVSITFNDANRIAGLWLNPITSTVADAQQVVTLLVEGKFEEISSNFDNNLRQSLSPQQMRQAWQTIVNQAGSFERQAESTVGQIQGHESVVVLCEHKNSIVMVQVIYDNDKKISGLWVNIAGPR